MAGEATASNTANRVVHWAQNNRVAVMALAASVAAVGAAGAYLYASGPRRGAAGGGAEGGAGDGEKSAAAKKKRSKKNKKSSGASKGASPLSRPDGPLLDEADSDQLAGLSAEELQRLPGDKRETVAQHLKTLGNKAYSNKSFEQAVSHYTKAIAAAPSAVFYSNRAACFSNMGRPEEVIRDCNEALKMDRTYVKALNRRAVAYEQLGERADADGEEGERAREQLRKSLGDFTAVAILGQFRDAGATNSVERLLKKYATSKAQHTLRHRQERLPSPTFVTAYLEAFRPKPAPAIPSEGAKSGDETLLRAYEALGAHDYPHALSLVNEAIEQGMSHRELEAAAYNLRGTFLFVIGSAQRALADFDRSTDLRPEYVQSWVKKASVHMELGDRDQAMRDFDRAIAIDPNDPDIYYHRGQVHFILSEFDAAIADYDKSTSLDDTFIFSQVQQAVAQYKLGNIARSTAAFRRILKAFEDAPEAYNYYGELLLDQQRHEDAIANFDKSIELERKRHSTNVLPMINKALVLFQWKQDLAGAEKLCQQALEIDPDCDVAIATVAQLNLQQSKIPQAIEYFRRSAEVARTEPELVNAITYEQASLAQLNFIRDFPEQGAALSQMASAMM